MRVATEATPYRIGVKAGFYVIQEYDRHIRYWRTLGQPTGDYRRALAELHEYEEAWRAEQEGG